METRSASRKKHERELSHVDEKAPKKAKKIATEAPQKKTKETKKEKGKKDTKHATRDDKPILHEASILERGHIYFFYRPKVEHEEAHNIDDVQRLYMILRPEHKTGKNRMLLLAAKKLPDHARHWAFVELATDNIEDITNKLGPFEYSTKTLGERHVQGARPCGCGVYSIVHHLEGIYKSSTHTHLAYVLEVPSSLGPVQHGFHIEREAEFIITVKNPKSSSTGQGLRNKERVEYPKELQDKFGDKKFIPVEPASLMDYNGAELILIGAKDSVVDLGKVGEELEERAEKEEKKNDKKGDHGCNLAEEQVFHKMHMHHKDHPAEPLMEGTWE